MLPNIRAVLAAVAAAIVLLMISFGLAARFRVAQENRTGLLQAEPPMGGPLPGEAVVTRTTEPSIRVVDHAAAKRKARQDAARKARVARIARERRTAAKKARAAPARAKQQAAGSFNDAPFGSFG